MGCSTVPIKQSIDITAQVLSALAAAHNAGVIHRDLKPDNVFITRVGDREGFVKVLDFGISKGGSPTPPEQPTSKPNSIAAHLAPLRSSDVLTAGRTSLADR